jgi:hypothetical protein
MSGPDRLSECRLCLKHRELRRSHFVPAALYPKNKKKVFATLAQTFEDANHVTDVLLCGGCEHRFNQNGEDEVLRWMAPKAKAGTSPLVAALREGTPVFAESDMTCYWGSSLGITPERYAYFALRLVWRASYSWPLPDGTRTTPLDLAEYAEPIRLYLLGEAPFPNHTYVALTACTDEKSRQIWAPPQRSVDFEPMIVFPIYGLVFRVWLGRVLPNPIHKTVFFPQTAIRFTRPPAGTCWRTRSLTYFRPEQALRRAVEFRLPSRRSSVRRCRTADIDDVLSLSAPARGQGLLMSWRAHKCRKLILDKLPCVAPKRPYWE